MKLVPWLIALAVGPVAASVSQGTCLSLTTGSTPSWVITINLLDSQNTLLTKACRATGDKTDCDSFPDEKSCNLALIKPAITVNITLDCNQLRALGSTTTSGLCPTVENDVGGTSTKSTSQDTGSTKSNAVAYVGVGVGAFIVGCLIVFFIFRNRRDRGRRRLETEIVFGEHKPEVEPVHTRRSYIAQSTRTPRNEYTAHAPTLGASRTPRRSAFGQPTNEVDQVVGFQLDMGDLELWRIDEKDLTSHELIAKGANGEVWVGDYRGMIVAIKKSLPAGKSAKDVQKFIDEIKLFTKLDHPHVTKFIGVSWIRPREIELVMEFMENGDLRKYLETSKGVQGPGAFVWPEKVSIMCDVVEGLTYLHSVDIIHRDLKSRNVLLTADLGAKLSDFGISKELTNETMTQGVGTFRWTAPELIAGERYTVAADIYSFGVLISELDTHDVPYADYRNEKNQPLNDFQIMTLVRKGSIQPHFTHGCPDWIYDLALRCISLDPDLRPTGPEISHILRQQMKAISPEGNSNSISGMFV
ncbi:hypothetical protein AC1031_021432 [Aphanomyces cochlioides]|nr:hypothetical protein AC1031_021432 [Aphanomyces cochlioides]